MPRFETKRRCLTEEVTTFIAGDEPKNHVQTIVSYEYSKDGKISFVHLYEKDDYMVHGCAVYTKKELLAYIKNLAGVVSKMEEDPEE